MRKLKVMLVDDEVIILEGFRKLFDWGLYGCEIVCEATDGMMAVNYAKTYKPDIVVMDINIPIISGLEAIRIIQEHRPDTAYNVVSGYDEFSYCREALRLQVADYILKPVNFAGFGKVIEDLKVKLLHEKMEKEKQKLTPDSDNRLIYRMTEYLQDHLSEDISLQILSDEFYLNSAYISRIFKNETGVNYHAYLTRLRMERAKKLLLTTDESIAKIALQVGFQDYRTFTKVFKNEVGELPSVYRNSDCRGILL